MHFLVAPYDAALPLVRLRQDAKGQAIRNVQNALKFQCGSACRQGFLQRNGLPPAPALDQAGLEDSVTLRRTAFDHEGER
jgi:hypothetical protein